MMLVRQVRGSLGSFPHVTNGPTVYAFVQTASAHSDSKDHSHKYSKRTSKPRKNYPNSHHQEETRFTDEMDNLEAQQELKRQKQQEVKSLSEKFDHLHAKMRANATVAKIRQQHDLSPNDTNKLLEQERQRLNRLGLKFDKNFAIERQRKQEIARKNAAAAQKHKLRKEQKQFTNIQSAPEDVMYREYLVPDEPENPKALDVAVIGRPNAGKSSIMNRFVDANVSAVSPKYNTTRQNVLGVYTQDNSQIVFYDTPGLIKPKERHTYVQELVVSASYAVSDADVSMLIIDSVKRIEDEAMEALQKAVGECAMASTPLLLVMNKMDLVQSQRERSEMRIRIHQLTDMIAEVYDKQFNPEISQYEFSPLKYTGKNCFKVSAATGKGVDRLRDTLMDLVIDGRSWNFHSSVKSELSDLELVTEIIREKLFRRLNAEVPYFMKQENVGWTPFTDHSLRIDQDIYVPSDRVQRMVIGKNGDTLRAISIAARKDIERLLGRPVHLYLNVRVAKGNNNAIL